MRVQTQALQVPVPLTPSAQSPSPRTPSTGKQHGQEELSFGRSTGAATLQAALTLGI